jgi:tRNA threonylcarbamoyladenosine biosynthesis protein TsaE
VTPTDPAGTPLTGRTAGPEDTRELGAALAGLTRPGDVVLLSGDLGAGKTVLAQGIARGLGVREQVTSPTFALVRHLPCEVVGTGGVRTLLHADLYRLERRHEVADLGLGQMVEEGAVAVVEWGEAAEGLVGSDVLGVRIQPLGADDDEQSRTLTFRLGGQWEARRRSLEKCLDPWSTAGLRGVAK